jgi:lysozyme family protein
MGTSAFKDALRFTLPHEGGYADDPDDPGGATNHGITQAVYDSWRVRRGWPKRSVRNITDQELGLIYEEMYWNAAACGQLDDFLGIAVFDFAVHSGPSRAVRFLQNIVGTKEDGMWGPKSAAALRSAIERNGGGRAGTSIVTSSYIDSRETFLRGIARLRQESRKYLPGWLKRVNDLRARVGLPVTPQV